MGTVKITPTWTAAMRIYIGCLESGTEEGKRAARADLMRLAEYVDGQQKREEEYPLCNTCGETIVDPALDHANDCEYWEQGE